MPKSKVTINGKEYDSETLSNEVKATLQSLIFVDNELKKQQAMTATLQTARAAYANVLNKELEKSES